MVLPDAPHKSPLIKSPRIANFSPPYGQNPLHYLLQSFPRNPLTALPGCPPSHPPTISYVPPRTQATEHRRPLFIISASGLACSSLHRHIEPGHRSPWSDRRHNLESAFAVEQPSAHASRRCIRELQLLLVILWSRSNRDLMDGPRWAYSPTIAAYWRHPLRASPHGPRPPRRWSEPDTLGMSQPCVIGYEKLSCA